VVVSICVEVIVGIVVVDAVIVEADTGEDGETDFHPK